jgi:hypothetical protein
LQKETGGLIGDEGVLRFGWLGGLYLYMRARKKAKTTEEGSECLASQEVHVKAKGKQQAKS